MTVLSKDSYDLFSNFGEEVEPLEVGREEESAGRDGTEIGAGMEDLKLFDGRAALGSKRGDLVGGGYERGRRRGLTGSSAIKCPYSPRTYAPTLTTFS